MRPQERHVVIQTYRSTKDWGDNWNDISTGGM